MVTFHLNISFCHLNSILASLASFHKESNDIIASILVPVRYQNNLIPRLHDEDVGTIRNPPSTKKKIKYFSNFVKYIVLNIPLKKIFFLPVSKNKKVLINVIK